ncbi:MAG: hypothetical protein DUD27_07710 [Lachnospiraceae bacterium]|uniref:M48 family metallopeptidase n=1 Tax=Candidatus Weimeria bifida TaxID=2599074 RepID=A0A6N7IXK3_9FIRM|nr:M48 family metallopeptidase [Candidatus Weimeria bifida]RRF95573.1 MAG: hypothetical protein DUD27_07710 [Lachnospiraceae bacterium]
MERKDYVHPLQDAAFEKYKDGVSFQKDIENTYDNVEYKSRRPDLLGKTVRVTEKQFHNVWEIMEDIYRHESRSTVVPVYVYEEYYYGAESYGISNPWIEISAKTIADFSEEELRFVLAREVYKITDGVTKQKTMMEERFKGIKALAPEEFEEVSKLSFYHWYRIANFTADNYGYLSCGSIKASVYAVLKMVLNSVALAEQVDIKEFIAQASEINELNDVFYNHTKADEPVPYAPHRLQNLMAYAESERGMKAMMERME